MQDRRAKAAILLSSVKTKGIEGGRIGMKIEGSIVRLIRNVNEMHQKTMADSLGITQAYLSMWEADKAAPSDALQSKFMHVYELNEIDVMNLRNVIGRQNGYKLKRKKGGE